MSGYQEILTDPSYAGQIITFTFPHIGNVGTNQEDREAKKPLASGLVVRENITDPANFRSSKHLKDWVAENNITGIYGIDTRSLTKYIGRHGLQNAIIGPIRQGLRSLYDKLLSTKSMLGLELAKNACRGKIARSATAQSSHPEKPIVLIDFGAKENIIRCLEKLGCEVCVVPAEAKAEEILAYRPRGVVLSNGPGDPAATASYATPTIRQIMHAKIPILGICFGHQLLALALGGRTIKMHCGHRGTNHPVKNLLTNKIEITSHNHGFAVERKSLPDCLEITHISLFDQTIEGMRSKADKIMSVQYHPESSPGTHESKYIFAHFLEMIEESK
ncbi:carbamoyl-phosphate synthase small chain [Rickettsiales bacterium]|nr:carbamoyl-phosphate synthase small chain [Rickettsiales bacterium]